MAFDGWALVDRQTVASVDIILNDSITIPAALGIPRPDVPQNLHEPRAAVACGWTATIDLTRWPLGDLRVEVIARSSTGQSSVIGHRLYTLQGEGFEGSIDEPREGAEVRGDLLVVRGWATIGHLPAARIDVDLNGRPAGPARLRVLRTDVERDGSGRPGPVTGFEYRGVVPVEAEHLEIGITVHALDGSMVAVPPRHVRVVASDETIDEPQVRALRTRTQNDLAELAPPPDAPEGAHPRLLVFTHSLALGGGQLYLSELLRQLMPTLAQCTVVSSADGILRQELESLGVDVRIVDDPRPRDVEKYEEDVRERSLFIRASGCDVVLLNTLGAWSGGDAAKRAGVPYLWAIHESFAPSDWLALNFGANALPPYVRRRMEGTFAAARTLIFEAHATSELFARCAAVAQRSVVPYGVDTAAIDRFADAFDLAAARRKHNMPLDGTVLLAMGIFEERKSQACIVEAFAKMAAVHPNDRLVLVGDHPCDYSDAIYRIIKASMFADRITLVPITRDIWEWYALSDVLVSASDTESLPRSMLECMAFGVPVLSTNVFGIPEVIEDDVNGWLFEPRDIGSLIAAMHRVLSLTVGDRRVVGEAGRVRVRQAHDSSNYGSAYRALLAHAIAE